MASKDKNKEKSNVGGRLSIFDKAAKKLYTMVDKGFVDSTLLTSKDQKFRKILNRELELSKGVSNGSIIDFVSSLSDTKNSASTGAAGGNISSPKTDNSLFNGSIESAFQAFQESYRNRFIELDDLKFISHFIPALGEAVRTILDDVASSDAMSCGVNRSINLPSSIGALDRTAIENEIELFEERKNFKNILKNVIYKRAIVTGTTYVYATSFNKIFGEYSKKKAEDGNDRLKPFNVGNVGNSKASGVKESYVLADIDYTPVIENVTHMLKKERITNGSNSFKVDSEIKKDVNQIYNALPVVECLNTSVYTEAVETVMGVSNNDIIAPLLQKALEADSKIAVNENKDTILIADSGTKSTSYKPEHFNITGTYIKVLDAKRVIPLRVFNQTIAYFVLHAKPKQPHTTDKSKYTGQGIFDGLNVSGNTKDNTVANISASIAEGILNKFNSKFVSDNEEYKELIANCIVANGLSNKDYSVQLIPAEDIIPFTINTNEDGFGESMIKDSLFPAKLLLSTMVTRLLNFINKTGNKTYAHIHKNRINAFDNNHINRVIRDIQEADITFNDLLAPNMVFNKFNRDGNIAMPTSQDGAKLVEFEIQEGQSIDMNPEYEQKLLEMAILGTGVPSSKLESMGNVDFAREIVSDNIKFAGRVSSIQADLEPPTTRLYKIVCTNSNLSDAQKLIVAQSMTITLPRPRVIENANIGEFVQNLLQTAEVLAEVSIGRDTLSNSKAMPNGPRVKELTIRKIMHKYAPFVEWDEVDEAVRSSILEAAGEENSRKISDNENDSGDDGGY